VTTTFSTDAQIDATETLARTALSAYSTASVDRATARGEGTPSDFAVTNYDALRVEAQRQLYLDLAARGISSASITDSDPLQVVEIALTLANLFEAVGQWNGTTPDIYARKGAWYRERYERAVAVVNPRAYQRPTGGSFEWGRG
jgi:hypothetical protein